MAEPVPDARLLLRDDLSREYYALLGVVSSYDGWLLIVKGWSVTLSLAALGLGFQQRHFALFALAAVTGAAFWYMDGLLAPHTGRSAVPGSLRSGSSSRPAWVSPSCRRPSW